MAKAKKKAKKRDRRAGIGLSTQPWRKADMAFLRERAAEWGIELSFRLDKTQLHGNVRTVDVLADSSEKAAQFISKYLAFPSQYRARATTAIRARPPAPLPPAEEPQETSFEEQCSFCGKRKSEVIGLVSGPCVYICNECVTLCNGVLGDEEEERHGIDQKMLSVIVRFARQLPAEVTDDLAVKVIDEMVDAKLAELQVWDRARGRHRIDPKDALAALFGGVGLAYAAANLRENGWPTDGPKASPTSVDGTASSTEGAAK